ncbi:MAG TPA: phosphonate ABC transporter ATP-binding protein [Acetobacteraceae bacterium]|nr:phosphonate ABC transporter ATP-binding protein [Acetobacteraceae bacterium]
MAAAATGVNAAPRLVASHVGKVLAGRPVLQDVSLTTGAHEFVAVLGPSGAGKTTLFRCLTGLLAPDGGSVRVDGTEVAELHGRLRRRVAVVFQQFNLVARLTALENVLAGRLGHVSTWRGWLRCFTPADRLLAVQCLDRVGVLAQADQRADTLSGGQQQRIAIARALAQQPRLIVADEPVSSLDPASGAGILELLRGIARTDGVAVVCSLHQVQFARLYADRIVGLAQGQVAMDVPATAFDSAAFAQVYSAEAA